MEIPIRTALWGMGLLFALPCDCRDRESGRDANLMATFRSDLGSPFLATVRF